VIYLPLIPGWGEVPRDVVHYECVGVCFDDHRIGGEVAEDSGFGI
jgi:hypothetical protein